MDNKKTIKDKKELNSIAENLVVDLHLQNRGKDNLDKSLYNSKIVQQNLDKQINLKQNILKDLRNRRLNTSSLLKKDDDVLLNKINLTQKFLSKDLETIENTKVDTIDIDRSDFETRKYNENFAELENINLNNPFMNLFSKIEQIEMASETINQFDLLRLDNHDYLFASAAGLISGFIDVIFVGTIKKGNEAQGLQNFVDSRVSNLVEKYGLKQKIAQLEKQKKYAKNKNVSNIDKVIEEYKSGKRKWDVKSSIRFLEKKHKVSYDTAMSKNIPGMSPDNHHLYSLAHEPSLLGLIVGIHDQLTGNSTFMSNKGRIIQTPAENINNEINGDLPTKIIQATQNWFGHIMSDISGSSTSKGRGSGLPVPGWASLQKLQFGSFKLKASSDDTYNIAEISEWMFKNGYDIRSFTAELIPVLIYETLLRLYWFYKQHFYFGKSIKESLPIANKRELSRLLLISASTFSAVDVSHATIKSSIGGGFDLGTFLMTVNKPGLLDFGFRSLQTVHFEYKHSQHLKKIIDEEVLTEYRRVINNTTPFE